MNFFGLVWLVSMENNLLADQHLSRRWQSTPSAQQTVRFAPPQFADELATSLPTSAAARTEAATRPVVAQTNAAMTQRPRPSQQSEAILQSKAADVAQKVTTALEQSSFETVKQDKKPQRSYLSSHLDLLSSALSIATHHSEKLGLNVDASSQAWLDQSQGWLSATGDLVLESTQALVQPQDLAGSFDDEQAGAKEDSDRPDSSAPISARSKPDAESEANATTIRSFPVEAQSPSEGQTSKTADKPAVDPRSKVSTNVAGDAEVKIAAVTVAEVEERLMTSATAAELQMCDRNMTAPKPPKPDRMLFQVSVRGQPVLAVHDWKQATLIAAQIRRILTDTPSLSPEAVYPDLVDGVPGGYIGEEPIFTVDQRTADLLHQEPAMLAITWANQLRQSLNGEPMAVADAQIRLHDLVATSQEMEGTASWYGPYFHGRLTATGETFDQEAFTAAHPSLPFDTYLRVTNLQNGRSLIVRVNDRGPYVGDRSLDLSRRSARCLGSESPGVVPYKATIMVPQ